MRRKFERPPAPVLLGLAALYVVGAAGVGGGGVALGFWLDEPATITETITHDAAPACREIEAELQAERARVEHLAEAQENVDHAAADLAEVTLSADPDAIIRSAEILDTARRDEQQTRLDLATAHATTDAAVADCAPEREQ
ncbi:hypothetical protein [Promicromonospora sp. NPDC023805]|uniref:hypothetical protein n=1 Tax=Promicromonospora sp. NPDC023805 TaxID=3154696 RepID=UPI0033F8A985